MHIMKTMEIHPEVAERDIEQLSAALCPTAPRSVRVYDNKGRAVPVTFAGFVVQPGRWYEVRARLDMDETLPQRARLIGMPGIVDYHKEQAERPREAGNGERWQCLRMRIRSPSVWLRLIGFLWYHTIRTGDVVVEWQNSKYPGTPTSATVPLIVRKPLLHWQLVLWFFAWFAIGMIGEGLLRLGKDAMFQDLSDALHNGDISNLWKSVTVPWVMILALSWPLSRVFWYVWSVFDRARELQTGFREKYWPDASTGTRANASAASI